MRRCLPAAGLPEGVHKPARSATGLAGALCVAVLLGALACSACCGTREATPGERQLVTKAVESYVQAVRGLPEDVRSRVPAWLVGAESVRVLKVERVRSTFKALVEFESAGQQTTRYLLVQKKGGQYRVCGVL